MQAQKLFNDQEQEEHSGKAEPGEILPVLPETHGAQGNKSVTR
jgi:hypothetical protein